MDTNMATSKPNSSYKLASTNLSNGSIIFSVKSGPDPSCVVSKYITEIMIQLQKGPEPIVLFISGNSHVEAEPNRKTMKAQRKTDWHETIPSKHLNIFI